MSRLLALIEDQTHMDQAEMVHSHLREADRVLHALADTLWGSNLKDSAQIAARLIGEVHKVQRGMESLSSSLKGEHTASKWGFDLTSIDGHAWKRIMTAIGIKSRPKNIEGAWHWRGEGVLVVTGNDPITGEYGTAGKRDAEPGYAGYIGIEGEPSLVKKAVSLIKEYGDAKGDSPGKRNFI